MKRCIKASDNVRTYRNKRNKNKYLDIKKYDDGHTYMRPYMKWDTPEGEVKNYMGSKTNKGRYHRVSKRWLNELLPQYEIDEDNMRAELYSPENYPDVDSRRIKDLLNIDWKDIQADDCEGFLYQKDEFPNLADIKSVKYWSTDDIKNPMPEKFDFGFVVTYKDGGVRYFVVDGVDLEEYLMDSEPGYDDIYMSQKIKKSSITAGVDWSYYDKPEFKALQDKYLPRQGQGDSMASQIVTAVVKLVYKWYNDGDVYDNNYVMQGWANDLSDEANWLYENVPSTKHILEGIYDCYTDDEYEDILKRLVNNCLNADVLEDYDQYEPTGSIYNCSGPFSFNEHSEEDEEDEYYY